MAERDLVGGWLPTGWGLWVLQYVEHAAGSFIRIRTRFEPTLVVQERWLEGRKVWQTELTQVLVGVRCPDLFLPQALWYEVTSIPYWCFVPLRGLMWHRRTVVHVGVRRYGVSFTSWQLKRKKCVMWSIKTDSMYRLHWMLMHNAMN